MYNANSDSETRYGFNMQSNRGCWYLCDGRPGKMSQRELLGDFGLEITIFLNKIRKFSLNLSKLVSTKNVTNFLKF